MLSSLSVIFSMSSPVRNPFVDEERWTGKDRDYKSTAVSFSHSRELLSLRANTAPSHGITALDVGNAKDVSL